MNHEGDRGTSHVVAIRKETSRRRFVLGASAAAGLAGLGVTSRPGTAQAALARATQLKGSTFDLTIGKTAVNFTGRTSVASAVNGSVPGPILRWRQGDTVILNVVNTLDVPTSIHWHGIRSPSNMDGVPGLSFPGIAPGETFTYRIPIFQSGTYWYHSHSMFQEQVGLYGAIVVEPKQGYEQPFEREHVVMLSDWSDTTPETIVSNLKGQSDYYNYGQRTVGTLFADAWKHGIGSALADRLRWGRMRMSPTDIADVTGAAYTYLLNGQPPGAGWTGLFRPGERVRLRLINGSSMTFFDIRIPGLKMTVVEADGNAVVPVAVDELRLGVAETYDVIVEPLEDRAYTVFAQSEDRSGYARGTLAPRDGMVGPLPSMDQRPIRTMTDMGMGGMDMSGGKMGMSGEGSASRSSADHAGGAQGRASGEPKTPGGHAMPGMEMGATKESEPDTQADGGNMPGMGDGMPGMNMSPMKPDATAEALEGKVSVDNVASMPTERLHEAGDGLSGGNRRVLTYADLKATRKGDDPRPPSREIVLHLTGNMARYMWGFDGRKMSQAEPIRLALGERVRFVLVNDTMMEHPIHLHGLWSELENGFDDYRPYKHTVIVKPGEKLSYLVTADTRGRWAFHCHLLYHMEMGMMREVVVA